MTVHGALRVRGAAGAVDDHRRIRRGDFLLDGGEQCRVDPRPLRVERREIPRPGPFARVARDVDAAQEGQLRHEDLVTAVRERGRKLVESLQIVVAEQAARGE